MNIKNKNRHCKGVHLSAPNASFKQNASVMSFFDLFGPLLFTSFKIFQLIINNLVLINSSILTSINNGWKLNFH